jgi:hypothetical protein
MSKESIVREPKRMALGGTRLLMYEVATHPRHTPTFPFSVLLPSPPKQKAEFKSTEESVGERAQDESAQPDERWVGFWIGELLDAAHLRASARKLSPIRLNGCAWLALS